jgi:mannose-6-phosphate isomerase-like protein (cupin superfamily)
MTKEYQIKTSLDNFVPKGWGYEKWIVNNKDYCGKILVIVKGMKCSWHYHKIKRETFYVQSGSIKLFYSFDDSLEDANFILLNKGDKFEVPIGLRHQMIAIEDTELFEFSTQHFDEDSCRLIKGN